MENSGLGRRWKANRAFEKDFGLRIEPVEGLRSVYGLRLVLPHLGVWRLRHGAT